MKKTINYLAKRILAILIIASMIFSTTVDAYAYWPDEVPDKDLAAGGVGYYDCLLSKENILWLEWEPLELATGYEIYYEEADKIYFIKDTYFGIKNFQDEEDYHLYIRVVYNDNKRSFWEKVDYECYWDEAYWDEVLDDYQTDTSYSKRVPQASTVKSKKTKQEDIIASSPIVKTPYYYDENNKKLWLEWTPVESAIGYEIYMNQQFDNEILLRGFLEDNFVAITNVEDPNVVFDFHVRTVYPGNVYSSFANDIVCGYFAHPLSQKEEDEKSAREYQEELARRKSATSNYCTLQLNLTRENTKGDKALGGVLKFADWYLGTTVGKESVFDVAVYMDNELLDVIPDNASMRKYSILVEPGSTHELKLYNCDQMDLKHSFIQTFKIKDNQVFAYKITPSAGGTMAVKQINSSYDYDYDADIGLYKTLAKAAGYGILCYKIMDGIGVIDSLIQDSEIQKLQTKDFLNDYNDSLNNELSSYRERKAEEEAAKLLEQKKKNDAKKNYYYLLEKDPNENNAATREAGAYYRSFK